MRYKHFVLALLLFFFNSVNAQKYELGKVSIAELEQKVYAADTTAAAAILFNKGKSHFEYVDKKGFKLVHEYEFRIKIYKKEGLKWADFKVPYYVGYETMDEDQVSFSNAVTYNLENGQIVKTKLSGEGKFKKDVNEFWNEASIAMPNVKPGSVIEFKYTHKSDDIVSFPEYNFQYDIPVVYSEYTTQIPQFFVYKSTRIGFGDVASDAKVANGYMNFMNQHQQTVNVSFQQVNSVYKAEKIPALKDEPFVDNLENYRLSIKHELEKTIFPDEPEKNYAKTWEGVASTIYKDKQFGKELKERSYFEPFLEPLIKNAATQTEKANAVFEFVKRSIHWDGMYGYYTRKGVRKAFEDQSGNTAEVNFILIAMLNAAGVAANPVLVSTVSHGVPAFPNRTVFNYVIAAAEIDGKQLLLDATEKNATFNILPSRALNWTGRLIKADGSSKEINLVPATASKQSVNLMAKIESDGKVSGKLRVVRTEYDAFAFRERSAGQNREQYIEKLEDQYGEIRISEYTSDAMADLAQPVTESFTFVAQNNSEIIGDKIFINPMLFFTAAKNPFEQEERLYPIYYGYPFQKKYNIILEIPEGYAIESMPKSIRLSTGENVGNFTFSIAGANNKIQITAVQEINSAIISGEFYPSLKEFYKRMYDAQNEKIILKKV